MRADTERKVPVWPAVDLERMRIRKLLFIAVGGTEVDADILPFFYCDTTDLGIFSRSSDKVCRWRNVTQHFIYGGLGKLRLLPQLGELLRVSDQRQHALR